MTRTTILRGAAVIVASLGIIVPLPNGAMARTQSTTNAAATGLTTHSATDTTVNSAGQLVATALCGPNQHVVSGGFKSPDQSAAVVSHAVSGDRWTVHLYPGNSTSLTAYAYCSQQDGITKHEHEVAAAAGPTNNVAQATCPLGQTLVSGGYAFVSTSDESNSPTYRDFAATPRKWLVMAIFSNVPANLEAFAYCEKGVTVHVRSTMSASIPSDSHGSATAKCHTGETLLGGGYTTTPTPDWDNTTGPDIFYSASFRSGALSWTAKGHNYSNMAGTITAFAYCEA